jgi:hypothetical protein
MKEAAAPITTQAASKKTQLNSMSRSTSGEAQRDRIVQALRSGPKTSYDLRCLGCYQAPARIKELRDQFGYSIRTERVTLYDHEGYMHPGAARYHLEAEPIGAVSQ